MPSSNHLQDGHDHELTIGAMSPSRSNLIPLVQMPNRRHSIYCSPKAAYCCSLWPSIVRFIKTSNSLKILPCMLLAVSASFAIQTLVYAVMQPTRDKSCCVSSTPHVCIDKNLPDVLFPSVDTHLQWDGKAAEMGESHAIMACYAAQKLMQLYLAWLKRCTCHNADHEWKATVFKMREEHSA